MLKSTRKQFFSWRSPGQSRDLWEKPGPGKRHMYLRDLREESKRCMAAYGYLDRDLMVGTVKEHLDSEKRRAEEQCRHLGLHWRLHSQMEDIDKAFLKQVTKLA